MADEPDVLETGEGGVIETMRATRCGYIVGGSWSRNWNLLGWNWNLLGYFCKYQEHGDTVTSVDGQ